MVNAVFAGSFDPPTKGHLNIIERASKLFSHLDVVIAVNIEKKSLFSIEERIFFINEMVKHLENVSVSSWNGLVVDFAEQKNASVLVRGVRNDIDFDYEFELSKINRRLNPEIETVFIPTENELSVCKSSTVKELAKYHQDVSDLVSPVVNEALMKKFQVE